MQQHYIDRFWGKVDKSGECWVWQAGKDKDGYGQYYWGVGGRAHKFAWIITHGELAPGLQLNHHCDNPACVRPDHLYAGTQRQNRADSVKRGRTATGERNAMYKHPTVRAFTVSAETAERIKALCTEGQMSHRAIGRMFGISHHTVANISRESHNYRPKHD